MTVAPAKTKTREMGLRTGALGFPAILGQGIALISPTMTAVLIIPLAFSNAGGGTWLSYLFATVMLVFVVFCINEFARRSAAPGAQYTFIARGLGPVPGVLGGWTLLWCYLLIGTAGLTGFAIFCQQLLDALGYTGTVKPVLFFAASAALCWFVAYKDIRLSSYLTLALEGLSVACILSLAGYVVFAHGFTVDTDQLTLKGVSPHGMSLAVVACIFSLVGFESATALGSEAKNPLRNVPRGVIWSLVLSGLFMVIMGYVEVFGTRGSSTPLSAMDAPLNSLAAAYGVSFFKIPISLCAMISFFGLSLSCLNAGSRILLPMAEHGVFPHQLAKTHGRNETPHIATSVYIVVMFLIPTVLEIFTNPLNTFDNAGTLAAWGFLVSYFGISIAAPVYLKKRGELRPRHIVITVIACLCLLVPTEGSFYPVPPFPTDIFPYIFLLYLAAGGAWLFILSRRRRTLFSEIEADLKATLAAHELREEPVPAPVVSGPDALPDVVSDAV
jgi:amino acid transporter